MKVNQGIGKPTPKVTGLNAKHEKATLPDIDSKTPTNLQSSLNIQNDTKLLNSLYLAITNNGSTSVTKTINLAEIEQRYTTEQLFVSLAEKIVFFEQQIGRIENHQE